MRLYSVVVLSATTLAVSVHRTLASDLKATTHINNFWGLVDNRYVVPTQRFLRAYKTTEDAEERVGGASKVTNWITSSTSKLNDFVKLKPGAKLLKKYQLLDDVSAALTSSTLSNAIEAFNLKKPKKKITLTGTLSAHYGEVVVAKAIVAAQEKAKTPEAIKRAKTLSDEQFSTWVNSGETVESVFKKLKFSDDGSNVFSSRFNVLNDYITFYNAQKSEQKALLNTLTTAFDGESNLVSMIAASKMDLIDRLNARSLESALLKKWGEENMQLEPLMTVLKLDNGVDTVFSSANLRTFEKYILELKKQNPDSKVSLLGTLTAKYGEVGVAKALVSAKNDRATEAMARKLQREQLEGWLKNGKSVDDVFTLLKLKNDVYSRSLETLKAYITLFNNGKSQDETLIKTLSVGFGGELNLAKRLMKDRLYPETNEKATYLQNMLFKQWMNEKVDSTNVLAKKLEVIEPNEPSAFKKAIAESFENFSKTETEHNVAPTSS